jgi:hypothetical protein
MGVNDAVSVVLSTKFVSMAVPEIETADVDRKPLPRSVSCMAAAEFTGALSGVIEIRIGGSLDCEEAHRTVESSATATNNRSRMARIITLAGRGSQPIVFSSDRLNPAPRLRSVMPPMTAATS